MGDDRLMILLLLYHFLLGCCFGLLLLGNISDGCDGRDGMLSWVVVNDEEEMAIALYTWS